jgi:DNA-binding NarL/FixJ family response regulator
MNPICAPAFRKKPAHSPAKILVEDTATAHSTEQLDHLHTIAFVDDEECDRIMVSQILAKSGKFHPVSLYSSAEEALREIPGGKLQVVLMDIRMPQMSGLECARQLRGIRPHLVIIMISGLDHPEIPGQALEAGADAYMAKPFSLGRFFEILTNCLRRRNLEARESQARRTFRSTQTKETPEPVPTTSFLGCATNTLTIDDARRQNQFPRLAF